MNEVVDKLIQEEFEKILHKLVGGRVFGEPILIESPLKVLVVAAYYLGELQRWKPKPLVLSDEDSIKNERIIP